MADEQHDNTSSLMRQIDRLARELGQEQAKVGTLTAERDKLAQERKELAEGFTELEKDHETLKGEFETFKGSPSEHQKRIAELEGRLRDHAHKGEFAKLAKGARLREEALDDLWKLSGYQAEADVPDPKALQKILDDAKANRAYLFAPDEAPAAPGSPPPPKPVPGADRGGSATPGSPRITRDQLQDPTFMLDPKNAKVLAEASANGTLNWD